jgi:hypothetical protein
MSRELGFPAQVSDLRQSRRLEEGGAAQGRLALRAIIRRLRHIPTHIYSYGSQAKLNSFSPSVTSLVREINGVTLPFAHNPIPDFQPSPALLPPKTPGTVKLWESSGRAGGLPVDSGRFASPSVLSVFSCSTHFGLRIHYSSVLAHYPLTTCPLLAYRWGTGGAILDAVWNHGHRQSVTATGNKSKRERSWFITE